MPKKGGIPHNKGKKKSEWRKTVYIKTCPFCKMVIRTSRKDQIYCNVDCYAKSEKLREYSRDSYLIKNNSENKYHLGHKHSDETKRRIINHLNRYSFPAGKLNPGVNKSKETIRKIKEKRLFQKILKKDTKPEKVIQELLLNLGVGFEKHKPILDIQHKYQSDIFIEPNIIIECDGDYYHNYPDGRDIDKIRTDELIKRGYKILRFWENEINNNLISCRNKILEALNERRKISQMQTKI
ncbi:MAG: DUF559 domain-containing protein [Nanoarchaeota archaeon]